MATGIILLQPPYAKRGVPHAYDAGWFTLELGNLQRAMPSIAIRTVRSDYVPTSLDSTVLVDASAGPVTIAVPKAPQAQGFRLTIKKIDASGNAVMVSATVDATTNPTLATQYDAMTIQSDGLQYYLLGSV